MADPPVSVGATQVNDTELGVMDVTVRLWGADATSATTTELLVEAVLAPDIFTALTRNTYVAPVSNPGIARLVDVDVA